MGNGRTIGFLALGVGSLMVAKSVSTLRYWKAKPLSKKVNMPSVVQEIAETQRALSTPSQDKFAVTKKSKPVEFQTLPLGNKFQDKAKEILLEYENLGTSDAQIKLFGQDSLSDQYRFDTPVTTSYASGNYRLQVDGVDYAGVFGSAITPAQLAVLLTAFGQGTFSVLSAGAYTTYYISNNTKEYTELEINIISGNAILIQSDNTITTTASITLTGTAADTVTINWGDGNSTVVNFTGGADLSTHVYAVGGEYSISITGDMTSISYLVIGSPVLNVQPIGITAVVKVSIVSAGLEDIDITSFINANITQILLSGNDLSTAYVDAILAQILASGLTDGTLDLGGGTNGIPTGGEANAAYLALIAAGWNVIINNTTSIMTICSNNTASAVTTIKVKDSVAGRSIHFDWGDTSSNDLLTTGGTDTMNHTYGALGTYVVTISGTNLTDIETFEITTAINSFSNSGNYTALTTLDLAGLGLQAIIIRGLLGTTLATIDLSGNAMTVTVVDKILLDVDNSGILSGTLDLSGGTNSPPTGGASNPNLVSLLVKGWAVTTN